MLIPIIRIFVKDNTTDTYYLITTRLNIDKIFTRDVMNKLVQIQYISMRRTHGMLKMNGSECRVLDNFMDKLHVGLRCESH